MRFQILHETHYVYSDPVYAIAMEARLQPCNDDYQSCQRYRLVVSPKVTVEEYSTFSDLRVQYWTLLKASEVQIVSDSVVDIRERPLLEIQVPSLELDPIEFYAWLHDTTLTKVTPGIQAFASQFEQIAAEDWYQATLAVQHTIHEAIDFESSHTTTDTTASEVLELGCGVCQDFTHLMLATLRQLGIPARYASGYLNQYIGKPTTQKQIMLNGTVHQETTSSETFVEGMIVPSLRGTGASHAWCEVFFGPQYGWRGFDAANNLLVDQNFIRIGAGRDFRDITPVKGVHKGPAEEDLKVTVKVIQLT
ncbi:MAG: transglutaminase family protein [Chloroflexota bacterium]